MRVQVKVHSVCTTMAIKDYHNIIGIKILWSGLYVHSYIFLETRPCKRFLQFWYCFVVQFFRRYVWRIYGTWMWLLTSEDTESTKSSPTMLATFPASSSPACIWRSWGHYIMVVDMVLDPILHLRFELTRHPLHLTPDLTWSTPSVCP